MKNQLCPAGAFCKRVIATYKNEQPDTPVDVLNANAGLDVWPNKDSVANTGHACPQHKYCPEGTNTPLDIPRGTMQHLFAGRDSVDAI